jgi:general secretion pathway protein D
VPTPGQGPELLTPAERVRLITDERTNSIIVLAARGRLEEIRRVVAKLDVKVQGGGRIHVYYLKHADAEELSQTLNALISGQPVPSSSAAGTTGGRAARATVASSLAPGGQAGAQGLRSAITELAEGVTITADPPTNSLVIQASQEGFSTVSNVIAQLDVERPQVLVEALIMEVDVSDGQNLGFSGLVRILDDERGSFGVGSLTDTSLGAFSPGSGGDPGDDDATGDDDDDATDDDDGGTGGGVDLSDAATLLAPVLTSLAQSNPNFAAVANLQAGTTLIQGVLTASANLAGTNILSAPNILTSDNEEAEIKVGANIPIITSRVQSASGIETADNNLATSVNVERQDIGVTLRVTPQISEGDSVRLEIFQEITDVNNALSGVTGDPEEVGVSLSSRKVENTVVVANHETVVIGGLISDNYQDNVDKVPWLGDIPILGWLFKTTGKTLRKTNLLVFLTPHIVRTPADLEGETIRKREEFWERSERVLQLSESEQDEAEDRREEALAQGVDLPAEEYAGRNPVRGALLDHESRYPVERMREIELQSADARRRAEEAALAAGRAPGYGVLAAVYRSEKSATELLTELVDAGYDGSVEAVSNGGVLLYEIRLGPYGDLEAAQAASESVGQSFGLSPSVVVGEAPAAAPSGEAP